MRSPDLLHAKRGVCEGVRAAALTVAMLCRSVKKVLFGIQCPWFGMIVLPYPSAPFWSGRQMFWRCLNVRRRTGTERAVDMADDRRTKRRKRSDAAFQWLLVIVVAWAFSSASVVQAQNTTNLVSNTGQTTNPGIYGINATSFTTGAHEAGYTLKLVRLFPYTTLYCNFEGRSNVCHHQRRQ